MSPDSANSASVPTAPHRRRWLPWAVLSLAAIAAVGLGLWGWLRRSPTPTEFPPDPPLAELSSPFLNTRAGVKYVGDKVCAGCHGKLTRAYHGHPMGRSASMPGEGPERIPDTILTDNLRLSVQWQGKQLIHRVSYLDNAGKPLAGVPSAQAAIAFVLGSGTQGRAYVVDHDGYLYQSPLSWYSRIKKWDLSPGYQHNFRHFNRPIPFRCLFCHGDGAHAVEGTVNRYQSPLVLRAIGCERCHGPGELHVAARQRGDDLGAVDPTIVNPHHLTPALREDVCLQCHLVGKLSVVRRGRSLAAYRPGLPLSAFLSVFVDPPEDADNYKAVGHPEQLHVSRCYTASKGKLGCTSCHDPHQEPAPAQRVAHYRAACLSCHQESSCHLPVAQREREDKSDSCIRCHMPQLASSDIAHAAITDHRIPRSPDQPPRPDSGLGPTDLRLLSFFREQVHSPDPEYERDLGVALGTIPWQAPADKDSRRKAERALPLLDKAVRRAPGDVAAWEAKGVALVSLGRPAKALEALDKALEREPGRELTLSQAARVAEELDRGEAMLNYCRKLVAVNPWNAEGRGLLARAYFALEKWDQAQAAAKKTLELDPASCTARMVLVGCLLKRGEQREAEAEFDRIVALQPPNLDEMRRWYFARTR